MLAPSLCARWQLLRNCNLYQLQLSLFPALLQHFFLLVLFSSSLEHFLRSSNKSYLARIAGIAPPESVSWASVIGRAIGEAPEGHAPAQV